MVERNIMADARSRATSYRRGIYHQMELFKLGASGNGDNNWDLMCDSIENIKSDIKEKMVVENLKEDLDKVEKIIFWYRTLENRYVKNTQDGPQVVFPGDIKIKLNKNLRVAYELLVKALSKLGLLE